MLKRKDRKEAALVGILLLICLAGTLFFAPEALAANVTESTYARITPGPAALQAGAPSIDVSAFYRGDDNNNNSITIEWGLDGVDFSLGSHTSVNHPAAPYGYSITGLSNSQVYQVRVTFNDGDGTDAPVVKTGVRPYNPMIHNAVSTGSGISKWNNAGAGWGTSDGGSQYGQFTCNTCHDPASNNIKRIDASITAPANSFPGSAVVFDDVNDYALDDSGTRTTSNKVCNVCHSLTDHQRYDENSNGPQTGHYSTNDCVSCHKHKTGFGTPKCSDCHGGGMAGATEDNFWPDSGVENVDNGGSENDQGEHLIHMTALAALDGLTLQQLLDAPTSEADQIAYCARCHGATPGSDAGHYVGDDDGSPSSFQNMSGGADGGTAGSYAAGTCSNIDCHNGSPNASPAWYAGATSTCTMCHTGDQSNGEAVVDPASGLHYHATNPTGVDLHDDDYDSSTGNCTSCHTSTPSSGHHNNVVDTPDTATFNFQSSAAIDVKLNVLADSTDDTCAADCHSDSGEWYRRWSQDAFDNTPFNTGTQPQITATIADPLPARCSVCHGEFRTAWSEGTAHFNMEADWGSSGASHNSQNPNLNEGADCVDCHVYPDWDNPGAGAARHEDGNINITDDAAPYAPPDDFTPMEDTVGGRQGMYCAPCHEAAANDGAPANTFEFSTAFPGWGSVVTVPASRNPEYTCFSGANGCHGDTADNWWPNLNSTDPADHPNRGGAHYAHGTTIGELLAEQANIAVPGSRIDADGNGRVDATQEDRNKTCNFCHPMTWNPVRTVWESNYHRGPTPETGTTIVDVFGGNVFNGADKTGLYSSGDPSNPGEWTDADTDGTTGFAYQLEEDPYNPGQGNYPLDHDAEYYQFLPAYAGDNTVLHGVCSQVACHSNAPYTPNWYGDDQAPETIADLAGATHDTRGTHVAGETDQPGTVLLTWTAPGEDGSFGGRAYEYEVFYRPSANGAITTNNLPGAAGDDGFTMRAGGPPAVYVQGISQEMVVDGLTPDVSYNFAVRTKDTPQYTDPDHDGIHDNFVKDGNLSALTTVGPITSHTDDMAPVFWGVDGIEQHDEEGVVNLTWESARDHSLPLEYRIWYTTYSLKTHLANGGNLHDAVNDNTGSDTIECYTAGTPPTAQGDSGGDYCINSKVSSGNSSHVEGLQSNTLYNFVVRAYDANGNHDDNTISQMAMPTPNPTEPTVTEMHLVSSASGMTKQADPSSPVWPGAGTVDLAMNDTVVFTSGTNLPREAIIKGISFDIQAMNDVDGRGRDTKLVSAELGYWNGGFVRIGPYNATDVQNSAVSLGGRATRLMKFNFVAYVDHITPSGYPLAVRIDRHDSSSGEAVRLSYGTSATKGQLLVDVQPKNLAPPTPTVTTQLRTGGYIDINWTALATDASDGGAPMHYDVFGTDTNGDMYVLATGVTSADDPNGAEWGLVTWDTVGDGITNSQTVTVSVEAGDGYVFEDPAATNFPDPLELIAPTDWIMHSIGTDAVAVNNTQDQEPPAAVTIDPLKVERRPKQGSVYLEWLSVGNDGYNHGTRAVYYDLRYRNTDAHGALNSGNWDDANTVKAYGEPVPQFSGRLESFELLNMTPDCNHDLAIVTCDAGEDGIPYNGDDNCSGMSNVVSFTAGQYYCGLCHTTPPSEPDTAGTHMQHGFTLTDCAKCHGDGNNGTNDVTTYDGRHYDGVINVGWAENDDGTRVPLNQIPIGSGGGGVTITQNTNNNGNVTIYTDPDGAGGYNAGTAYNPGLPLQNTDSGKCMNFGSANVSGCHGPFQPKWASDTVEAKVQPQCADCHGDKTMVVNDDAGTGLGRLTDPYGRQWDDYDDSQAQIEDPPSSGDFYYPPNEQVLAAPPTDNHGASGKADRYTGAHLRHLNQSFRFAKQDSCRLCHKDTMESGLHANREVDVIFDGIADQDDVNPATIDQTHGTVDTEGASCGSLNNMYCHDTGTTPKWATPGAQCNGCHDMGGKTFDPVGNSSTIGHVSGSVGDVVDCTYCHVAGHPQSPDGVTAGDPDTLLINNNAAIGINYRSGGIHLKRVYPWGTFNSLAEICWGCHDQNNDGDLNDAGDINEFGPNQQAATGNTPYDYGTLNQKNWIGATWTSAKANFAYKTGYIQSTHTTDPTGVSTVTWDAANGRYNETVDTVDKIRCSNCHDVHDRNLADGDTLSGAPYLRGTWMGNPYEEDGAPWNKAYSDPPEGTSGDFGPVPRAGTNYNQLGGYFIDQNNVVPGSAGTDARYPTSGWTVTSSAGLCVLCHGDDVDNMDKLTGESLWVGSNGHSNAALGGTGANKSNIFDYTHGRPVSIPGPLNTKAYNDRVADMAHYTSGTNHINAAGNLYIYQYRSKREGLLTPNISNHYAFQNYDWGVTVDAGTTDVSYHQFSCSKCHNPHASRLPKLLITNCLDIRHNTWDDSQGVAQTQLTHANLDRVDRDMSTAYYASAQNCHRFDAARGDENNDNAYDDRSKRGGWNRVSPWVKDNISNVEHKGSRDPAYGTSNGTSPWRHSDFPTENNGWNGND